jgi:hypothetical protein
MVSISVEAIAYRQHTLLDVSRHTLSLNHLLVNPYLDLRASNTHDTTRSFPSLQLAASIRLQADHDMPHITRMFLRYL